MQHTITELETALQKRIEEMKLPGVSVCIRGPEGVIYEKGFGKRSIEQDLDVTPDTVFGIASMSKSFTALSCCILAAEGKMSLEDPITKYFPTLHLKGVPDELVTIRQIGLHRAGIPPMEPLEWSIAMNTPGRKSEAEEQLRKESPNQMDTIEQIVDYIAEGRYQTLGEPGEYMSYSNEGYAILSYVVDQAAGMPLEQFLMERIFKPLGMTRTILDQDCSELKAMVGDGNVTRLFETDDDGKLVEDDSWSVLPPFRGCACIKSTAPDMARYYQMLSNRGTFEGKRIVPEEAIDLMFGPEYPLRRKPFNVMGLKKRSILQQERGRRGTGAVDLLQLCPGPAPRAGTVLVPALRQEVLRAGDDHRRLCGSRRHRLPRPGIRKGRTALRALLRRRPHPEVLRRYGIRILRREDGRADQHLPLLYPGRQSLGRQGRHPHLPPCINFGKNLNT